MKSSYQFSEDFDPHHAIYALKGISYFLHDYYSEGPGVYRTVPEGHHSNLLGLAWLQRRLVNELYDYFAALDEAGINLPNSDEYFAVLENKDEVRDQHGLYLVNSR